MEGMVEIGPEHPPLAHPNFASGLEKMSDYAEGFGKRKAEFEKTVISDCGFAIGQSQAYK